MRPRFGSPDDGTGVAIVDPIENNQFTLYTPGAVSLKPTDTESFVYPVSVARRFVASEITLPHTVSMGVRRQADGAHICDVNPNSVPEMDADEYLLNISEALKIYIRVDSSLRFEVTSHQTRIEFGGNSTVEIGARSHHDSAASTITVPDDPEAAMDAISTFGSALKTTSPERSWPTLRGHPPRIKLGDELRIPDEIEIPETGVEIRVPPDYEHVFPVAPLAHYLGATVVPGEPPRLTTADGFVHRLDGNDEFETEVGRVLRQIFVLDCATRTEGFHPATLPERRAVESVADFDFAALYDAPLAERLPKYLSVPEAVVDEVRPTWSRVTYVRPVGDSLELLPYVTNELSLLRVKSRTSNQFGTASRRSDSGREALSSFKRNSMRTDQPADSEERPSGVPAPDEYVPLPNVDALERAWVGDGTPVHGTKLHLAAFRHEWTESTDGIIEVTVVCNDEQMREEWDAVSDIYGTRDAVSFDVDFRFGVSVDELRTLLTEDHDLFHFIGHVDGRGLACPDGLLDAETLSETGATTILLNACRSHDQGVALVEAGARAAVVSWGDVGNLGAVEVGETFAKLLNYGFSVGGAFAIVEEYTSIGRHYVAIGDPSVSVAQCTDATTILYEILSDEVPESGEAVELKATTYPVSGFSVGSATTYFLRDENDPEYFTTPGTQKFTNTVEEIESEFSESNYPMVLDGKLRWSDALFGSDSTGE